MHPEIADELAAQNLRYGESPAREANLAALRRGAKAVITGQQVGLFLGPLYTLYKAAAAIRDARALAAQTGEEVVPVFWLQTEDHDVAEIASCNTAELALALPFDRANRRSIAHLTLPEEIAPLLEEVRVAFGARPHFEPFFERLVRHYRPRAGWAEAFAGLMAELFREEGLLFIDPRTPVIARHAAPLHALALSHAEAFSELLLRGRQAVHVRRGAPLSFIHPSGPEGPRYRLERTSEGFAEVGGSGRHALGELLELLESSPLSFSTSALLRPLLQDLLFDTALYVGGPAELAYLEQLAPLYPLVGELLGPTRPLARPRAVPRAHFWLLEERTSRALSRHAMTVAELAQPLDALLLGEGEALERGAALERELAQSLAAALERSVRAVPVERLETPLRKARSGLDELARRLGRRLTRSLARRDTVRASELLALKETLYPEGHPQERVHGMVGFAARYGDKALVERLLAEVRPFEGAFVEVALGGEGEVTA